jgi:hypothetical protein
MSLAIEFPLSNENLQAAQPQYSIVVPAYNERERIGGTLVMPSATACSTHGAR